MIFLGIALIGAGIAVFVIGAAIWVGLMMGDE